MPKKSLAYDALPASKADIRKFILKKRNSLTKKQIRQKSAAITKKILALPAFRKAKTIFTYVSFGSEVGTRELIKKCISLGKKVVISRAGMKRKSLMLFEFNSFSALKKSSFGVPEPDLKKSKKILPLHIDLVIVPGVAFDMQANRMGYGKGFYDRFLSNHPRMKNVALAFEMQMLKKIPAGENDKKVMKIITEKRIVM